MSFIEEIKVRASKDIKTIILPEAEDRRVLEAAAKVTKEKFAKIILIGNENKIKESAKEYGLDLTSVQIVNPEESDKKELYAERLYELRKNKGMTLEEAKKVVLDPTHFGMMMLKSEDADGLVSGAAHSTSDTLRPALQILKTAPGTKLVSAFFVMCVPNCEYGEKGTFIFGDSGLNQNPNADELSEIAISSAKSFEQLVGKKSKVAMLSYSTYGSAHSQSTEKVIEAINSDKYNAIILNYANPDMVGHTGSLPAAIKAVETIDECVGKVVDAMLAHDGTMLITADHGNCEQMIDYKTGEPHTAHTTNPVPVILVGMENAKLKEGKLADLAPTMLEIMGLEKPAEMTGESIIVK